MASKTRRRQLHQEGRGKAGRGGEEGCRGRNSTAQTLRKEELRVFESRKVDSVEMGEGRGRLQSVGETQRGAETLKFREWPVMIG